MRSRCWTARSAAIVGVLVGLAGACAAASPAGRCTIRLSPGDDVQRAIDRLPARTGPASVCLEAGEFRLERVVSIRRDDVALRGEGASTVLRLKDGIESPVVVIGDCEHETPRRPTRNVTIERLRVVGGGAGGSEVHPTRRYLTNSAVAVRAGRGVAIRDLQVSACRSACILTERDTRDVAIEHNVVAGSVWDGISLNRTARAHVAGNVIRDNTAAGITAEHLEDSVLERNVLEGNKTHGIYLADSRRNRFADNHFVGNVLSGVFLTCAVRERTAPVTCWKGSMSQRNDFARDELVDNRIAFTVAPNADADCTARGFAPNRSRDDRFARNPRDEPYPPTYGRCLVFAAGDRRLAMRRAPRGPARSDGGGSR
jgi:parallel beta-helix repeat protein